MGSSLSRTPFFSARARPSGSGIHVPASDRQRRHMSILRAAIRTLVFAVSSLNLLVYTLLHFSLENPSSGWLVEVRDFQDVCSIDPIVRSTSHDLISFAQELVHRDLIKLSDCAAYAHEILHTLVGRRPYFTRVGRHCVCICIESGASAAHDREMSSLRCCRITIGHPSDPQKLFPMSKALY